MRPERVSLASQQTALLALITGRDLGGVALDADALIVGDARATADQRLQVYAHMYRARVVEALESQFPRLARRLGADDFTELCAAYLGDEPSRHWSLRGVGERLPPWMEAHRTDSPRLNGLAALEWARTDVFDLADEATLTLDAARAWPLERFGELPLQLVTAHRLITVPAGTARLWDALGTELLNDGARASEAGETESLLVWREGILVCHRLVGHAERAALELATQGTHFGVVCDASLATHGEEGAVAQAYAWISTWLTDGLLRA